jgi:hypothetical protein
MRVGAFQATKCLGAIQPVVDSRFLFAFEIQCNLVCGAFVSRLLNSGFSFGKYVNKSSTVPDGFAKLDILLVRNAVFCLSPKNEHVLQVKAERIVKSVTLSSLKLLI